MADQVQYILDRMAPVLVELQRLGIFSLPEVKSVIASRKQHEYKLKRRQLTVADFLEYLEYEMNLEQLRRTRMKRLRISNAGKAEGHGIRHVSYIFERAVRRFPSDIALWEAYLNFLQKYNSRSIFSSVLMRALHLHPRNAQLWIRAASMETVLNGNSHAARVMMQRAIRINPHDKELWLFYFKQEMFEAVKVQKRRAVLGLSNLKRKGDGSVEQVDEGKEGADGDDDEEMSNAGLQRLMSGDIASIVFNHAMERSGIKPAEMLPFALELYEQAFQYRHELPAVREAVESRVKDEFQSEAAMYLTLAEVQLFNGDVLAEQMSATPKRRKLDAPSHGQPEAQGDFASAMELLASGLASIATMQYRAKAAQLVMRFVRTHSSASNLDHQVQCKQLLESLVEPLLSDNGDSLATDESFQAAVQLSQVYYETLLLLPNQTNSSEVQQLLEASEWLFGWLQTAFAAIGSATFQQGTCLALTLLASTALHRLERFATFIHTVDENEEENGEDVSQRLGEMREAIAQLIFGVWRSICLAENGHEHILHALQYLPPAECLHTLREIASHASVSSVNDGFIAFWCKQLIRKAYQFEGIDEMLECHQFLMKNTFATAAASSVGGSKFLSYFLFIIDIITTHTATGDAAQRNKWYEGARQLHEQALRAMGEDHRQPLYDSYVKLEISNNRPERANQIRWRASKNT